MTKRHARQMVTVAAMATLVQGCASLNYAESEYSCPGRPDGITCTDVRDVYAMTNGDDYQQRIEAARIKQSDNGNKSTDAHKQAAAPAAQTPTAAQMAPVRPSVRGVLPQNVSEVVPLRTPAEVMRIYVRPWETKHGDLYVPGYIYTEIEPRRWMIGDKAVDSSERITILQATDSGALMRAGNPGGGEAPRAVGFGER